MGLGHIEGQAGNGATNTYTSRTSPTVDIPLNSSGGYTLTYQYWIQFAGQSAYKVFVNGVEPDPGAGYLQGSANWIPDAVIEQYDCINGACLKKTTYNTPGLYASLSLCEVACGTGCSGKCLSNADWTQIESLSSQIMNRNCS